ncbi:MAG: HlyD family efflux transporter periplasmic adaptor subunit [Chloroflexia bacterium]
MRLALPSRNTHPAASPQRNSRPRTARSRLLRLFVLLLFVSGAAAAFLFWRGQQGNAATPAYVDVPVVKGNLDVTVDSSGKVQPSRNVPVPFGANGRVNEVLVQPGDKVSKGQPLARLDDSQLKLGVQKVEAALVSAQAKLNALKVGPTASSLAAAQADLASARADYNKVAAGATSADLANAEADLRSAQAQLDTAKADPTVQDLSDAQADLTAAQTRLAKVKAAPSKQDLASAQAAVTASQAKLDTLKAGPSQADLAAAEAALKAAQLKFASIKAGPSQADISKARLSVTDAETSLTKASSSASVARQQAELALDQADHAMKDAQDKYYKVARDALDENGKLRTSLDRDLQFKYPTVQDLIDAYNSALRDLQDAEDSFRRAKLALDDARLTEIQTVKSAQAHLDDANTQLQHLLAGPSATDLAEAQANVDSAQKSLDKLKAPPSSADLADARANLIKAQNSLADLQAGPSASDLADAQAAVTKAQNKLAGLKAPPSASTLTEAQAGVDKARIKLASLKAGPTASDLAAARAKVASAESNLAKLKAPATEEDLASAQAAVVQAQVARDQAKFDLAGATLTAPFDGTVAEVPAIVGATATAGTKAVVLNDASGMHLDIELSESDVAKVQKGQPATLTFDAVPDKSITGTVTSIAPAASDSSSDVVTYLVQVAFNPGGLPVRVGMSADATVRVDRRDGVIQVPSRAIKSVGPFKTVQILYGKDKKPVTVQVQTGATNGQMTEILSCPEIKGQCLRQGDTVAVDISGTTNGNMAGPGGDQVVLFTAGPGEGKGPGGGGVTIEKSAP